MTASQSRSDAFTVLTIALYLALGGALYSFFLPVIQVKIPPAVHERWGAWDVVKALPKSAGQKTSKWDAVKLDFDFSEVLTKILPKTEDGKAKKLSLTFIAGILVPVALAGAYLFVFLGLLFGVVANKKPFYFSSGVSVILALYATIGTYYLGVAAQQSFQSAVEKASDGFLGVITKNIVQKVTVGPDNGLYVLLGLTILSYLIHAVRRHPQAS